MNKKKKMVAIVLVILIAISFIVRFMKGELDHDTISYFIFIAIIAGIQAIDNFKRRSYYFAYAFLIAF